MKTQYTVLLVALFSLTGCNPFTERQDKVKVSVEESEKKSMQINKAYSPKIRKIKDYNVYEYNGDLKDPFRHREFLIKRKLELEAKVTKDAKPVVVCEPPSCVPPKPHPKELLENYPLSSLAFVGTMEENGETVGLIRTPDFGVTKLTSGGYIGANNGVVIEIKETALLIQEKLYKSGVWENKKSVLMIKQ